MFHRVGETIQYAIESLKSIVEPCIGEMNDNDLSNCLNHMYDRKNNHWKESNLIDYLLPSHRAILWEMVNIPLPV